VALDVRDTDTLIHHILPVYIRQMEADEKTLIAASKDVNMPNPKTALRMAEQFRNQRLDARALIADLEVEQMQLEEGADYVDELHRHLEEDHGITGFGKSEKNMRWLHREMHKEEDRTDLIERVKRGGA
jgi:hypothetical protein